MPIAQAFLQDLTTRADIVEIVGRYVQLKKTGANFSGLCPFHSEKSPSFTVSPSKQFFHCFGCSKSGNAIGFLMEYAGMGFREAVEDLAGQYGLQVPEDDVPPAERERAAQARQKQATLNDVLERAAATYQQHLKTAPRAIDYFKHRGLSGAIAKRFGLGYAPEGWRALASVFPDYADPLLAESGLVITGEDGDENAKRYDRFRDRVMFPIRDVKGACIGFGGRVLGDEKPKYLNSPETPVFSKGRELYGLFEARTALREHGYALVTEGYMDVVALAQLGFANAVATLGTACTADHVHKLFRFTDSVVFAFDGDAAGRRAARKALDAALPHATDVRTVKFLFLPAEHDPDSFIRAHGADAFADAVAAAVPLSRFLLDASAEGCDLETAEGRAHCAANAKPLWTALPDGALKQQLLAELAQQVHLGADALQAVWSPPARGATRQRYENKSWSGNLDAAQRPFSSKNARGGGSASSLPARLRAAPPRREDHAARLLLGDMAALETLSNAEHELLGALPPPHGPLFVWLEGQLHEHGPLTWTALRDALRGHPSEALALQVMESAPQRTGSADDPAPSLQEQAAELRSVLDHIQERRIGEEAAALTPLAASGDAAALERLRALDAQRRALKAKR